MNTKTKIKWYWTKKRKKQAKYWGILLSLFLLAVAIWGVFTTYTDRYILNLGTLTVINYVQPIIEPEQVLSVEQQIRDIAEHENFEWADYLVRLAMCESRLDPLAINGNGNYPSNSTDRGLFQINNYWHYEVSDACAYNLECSTVWTINRINQGYQSEWVCDRYI